MEEQNPWVTVRKLEELIGWTDGQIRGYKDRLWTRNVHFALIGGSLMYNPTEIIKWQNSQVSDQKLEESKSGGGIKDKTTLSSLTQRRRKQTSNLRLGSVKSSLNCVN